MNAPARISCGLLAFTACASGHVQESPDAPEPGVDAPPDAPFEPALAGTGQLCKLLSNLNTSDPTPNDVQHAANVLGADLGIPVVAKDTFYLMFGDTFGFAGIWGATESHPDAVGYGLDSATAIAATPSLLCNRLRMISLPAAQSYGPTVNSAVAADFAGAAMAPPSGHSLTEYIHNPSGPSDGTWAHLPGDFEVPSGAFSVGDSIYVFYTTVVSRSDIAMKGSYLAKWVQPTTTGPFAYQILYPVDERFDGNGPLHGHFINVAAQVAGDYVYLFGTGDYRRSKIYLARKPLALLDTPGNFEELGEITTTAGYGEVSVRYFPSLQQWMVLAEELSPTSNHIVAYFAAKPEGPWSYKLVVHDMADPAFRSQYCCTSADHCIGKQMFNCNNTGFYGTYLFPAIDDTPQSFTVTYTMSSFSPYNVALFQAHFAK